MDFFFSFFPGLTSNREEICIKGVYEGGFIKWTSLNFTPNFLCAIFKKKKKDMNKIR